MHVRKLLYLILLIVAVIVLGKFLAAFLGNIAGYFV